MIIRNEKQEDYRIVEEMIKKAFWNLSVPGCNEHYFAHEVRKSEDFIPELDLVLEEDGKIIGHIIYVKAKLIADDGTEKEILSFGPFTIHPDYQRKGYGRKLLNHSSDNKEIWIMQIKKTVSDNRKSGLMNCLSVENFRIPFDNELLLQC